MSEQEPIITCEKCGHTRAPDLEYCVQCHDESASANLSDQQQEQVEIQDSSSEASTDPIDDIIVAALAGPEIVETTVVTDIGFQKYADETVEQFEDAHVEIIETETVNQGSPFQQKSNPFRDNLVRDEPVWMPGYEDFAARGGAVASLLLGIFSVCGSFLSPLAAINSVPGIFLAMWGISSRKKRIAITGMSLCVVGIAIFIIKPIILYFPTVP